MVTPNADEVGQNRRASCLFTEAAPSPLTALRVETGLVVAELKSRPEWETVSK